MGRPALEAYGKYDALGDLIDGIYAGEIKPFRKKSILSFIKTSLECSHGETKKGDGRSKIIAGGAVSIFRKIIKDIENKVV
jgi:hypothetical protein